MRFQQGLRDEKGLKTFARLDASNEIERESTRGRRQGWVRRSVRGK
jgi:hypothetical protein